MLKSKSLSSSLEDVRKLSKNNQQTSFSSLGLSPLRKSLTMNSLSNSPIRYTDNNHDLELEIINKSPRSISSSRKRRGSLSALLNKSPLRLLSKSTSSSSTSTSTSNSLESSPLRRYNISTNDYYFLKCAECFVKKLETNHHQTHILAIKCTCEPPKYFCSRHCHRCHFISQRQCDYYSFDNVDLKIHNPDKSKYFNNLDVVITWDETDYIHNLEDYIFDYKQNKNI